MGAFLRCPVCGRGHDKPTARTDLLDGGTRCQCGHRFGQFQSLNDWIADLDDRVTAIEESNRRTAETCKPRKSSKPAKRGSQQ